jgi:hypothetical protein
MSFGEVRMTGLKLANRSGADSAALADFAAAEFAGQQYDRLAEAAERAKRPLECRFALRQRQDGAAGEREGTT